MVVASYTNVLQSYDVTLDQAGKPTNCTCKDRKFRSYKPSCKHMDVAEILAAEEIAKAERFLTLKAQYDYRSPAQREARRARYVATFDPCMVA